MNSVPLATQAVNSTSVSNLRERALAAHLDGQARKLREEQEREQRRRDAHVELLRTLCYDTLSLASKPSVNVCGIKASNHDDRFRMPVVEIDGLLFTCNETDDHLRLVTFATQRVTGAGGKSVLCYNIACLTVHNLAELGKLLSDGLILGELEGDMVKPLLLAVEVVA